MELAILLDLDLEYEQRSPYFSSIQALIVSGLTVRVRIVRDALFEKMPGDAKDEHRSVAAVTTSSVHGGITEWRLIPGSGQSFSGHIIYTGWFDLTVHKLPDQHNPRPEQKDAQGIQGIAGSTTQTRLLRWQWWRTGRRKRGDEPICYVIVVGHATYNSSLAESCLVCVVRLAGVHFHPPDFGRYLDSSRRLSEVGLHNPMCNFSRKLAAWQPYLRTRLLAPGQGYAEESCQIFVGILPQDQWSQSRNAGGN